MQTGMQVVTLTIQGAPTPEQGWSLPSRDLDVLSSNEWKFLLPLCAPFAKNWGKGGGDGGFGGFFVVLWFFVFFLFLKTWLTFWLWLWATWNRYISCYAYSWQPSSSLTHQSPLELKQWTTTTCDSIRLPPSTCWGTRTSNFKAKRALFHTRDGVFSLTLKNKKIRKKTTLHISFWSSGGKINWKL